MSLSKKLICKGTFLRRVFIRVYRLEIQSVMLVFLTHICELLPSNLLSDSTLPPFPVWICILFTRTQCVRGGMEFWALDIYLTCRKVPLQENLLDDDILHCLLWVLSFYVCHTFTYNPVANGYMQMFSSLKSWLFNASWIIKTAPLQKINLNTRLQI